MADIVVPSYRYFTADIVTGSIVMEVPFSGVSWERKINTSGSFSGSIAVPGSPLDSRETSVEDHFDLYNTTVPGKHAIYVVRDGVCVWGGPIWSRDYDIVDRTLSVSASEFNSYFYHRVLWKSLTTDQYQSSNNPQDSDTVKGLLEIILNAMTTDIDEEQLTGIETNDVYAYLASDVHKRINTYFATVSGTTARFTTEEPHGFAVGDEIYIYGISQNVNAGHTGFDGTHTVSTVVDSRTFECDTTATATAPPKTVPTDDATYCILKSTYDLLQTNSDISLILDINSELANYITNSPDGDTPINFRGSEMRYVGEILENFSKNGVSAQALDTGATATVSTTSKYIVEKSLTSNVATITTYTAHGFTTSDSVTIAGVDATFNGSYTIASTPDDYSFTYSVTASDVAATSLLGDATPVRFDYYIESSFNTSTLKFENTFKAWLVRKDVNNPADENATVPELETLYGPSSLGANSIIFEHPGTISRLTIQEDAENAVTRLWMVDNKNDMGDVAEKYYGAYTNIKYLTAGYPILESAVTDRDLKVSSDEQVAPYAKQVAYRMSPPIGKFSVTVNGGLSPKVSDYKPGDWCVVIPNDPFIDNRLKPPYENRTGLLVRKIKSYSVSVPDNPAFPEEVTLDLVPEWEEESE